MVKIAPKKLLIILAAVLLTGSAVFAFLILQKPKAEVYSKNNQEEPVPFNPVLLDWERGLDGPFSARDSQTAIVFKDKIWLFGGLRGNGKNPVYEELPHFSDLWVSENGTNWQMITDKAVWGERRSIGAAVFKDKLWLIAGWNNKEGKTKNDIWSSDDGINWQMAGIAPFTEREGHSVVVFKDKLWVMGGVDYSKEKTYNDVWYSEDGINWVQATPKADWSSRWDQGVAVFKDKLWLMGGMNSGSSKKNDLWVSEDGINWQQEEKQELFLRQGHILLVFKDRLWAISGFGESQGLRDVWFSEDGKVWTKTEKETPWPGREDFSAFVFKDKIWMIAGMADENNDWVWKNDVWYSK